MAPDPMETITSPARQNVADGIGWRPLPLLYVRSGCGLSSPFVRWRRSKYLAEGDQFAQMVCVVVGDQQNLSE
jgi:hypothetical protein